MAQKQHVLCRLSDPLSRVAQVVREEELVRHAARQCPSDPSPAPVDRSATCSTAFFAFAAITPGSRDASHGAKAQQNVFDGGAFAIDPLRAS
jgi:hypothetical protein